MSSKDEVKNLITLASSTGSFSKGVSKTALMVAAARAVESEKPNPAFVDPYAR